MMKPLTMKTTKYEMINRIVKALELVECYFPELTQSFEYQQLNKLNERGMCHGLPESKLFSKQQLIDLSNDLLLKVIQAK